MHAHHAPQAPAVSLTQIELGERAALPQNRPAMAERPFIYRFTKDLRLDDHAGLAAAAARGQRPAVARDRPRDRARLRLSPRRAAFFCAAVGALDRELHERGSALVVRRGEPEKIVPALATEIGATGAAWSCAYDAAAIAAGSPPAIRTRRIGLRGGGRSRRTRGRAGGERCSAQRSAARAIARSRPTSRSGAICRFPRTSIRCYCDFRVAPSASEPLPESRRVRRRR